MINFNDLRIPENTPLQRNQWEGLLDNVDRLPIKINQDEDKVGIGTNFPTASLHIVNKNESPSHDTGGSTLIIGPTNQANLRLGCDSAYSWIQSHGSKPLAINPIGNNVGIGTSNPTSKLTVNGTVQSISGGFKFPDNSIQTRASQANIIKTGIVKMHTGSWTSSPLGSGSGSRSEDKQVSFSGFISKPYLFYSIVRMDIDEDENTRIGVSSIGLSKTGFKLRFNTWGKTQIYRCEVLWMAIGK